MNSSTHKYFGDVFWYETEQNPDFVLYYKNEGEINSFHNFIDIVKDIDVMHPLSFLKKLMEIKVLAIAYYLKFPPENWVKKEDAINLLDYWENSTPIPILIYIGGHNPPLWFDTNKRHRVGDFAVKLTLSYEEGKLSSFDQFLYQRYGRMNIGIKRNDLKVYVEEWLNS